MKQLLNIYLTIMLLLPQTLVLHSQNLEDLLQGLTPYEQKRKDLAVQAIEKIVKVPHSKFIPEEFYLLRNFSISGTFIRNIQNIHVPLDEVEELEAGLANLCGYNSFDDFIEKRSYSSYNLDIADWYREEFKQLEKFKTDLDFQREAAQRSDYNIIRKNIKTKLKNWGKKDEFEKTPVYINRLNDISKIYNICYEAILKYFKETFEIKIGAYNADEETLEFIIRNEKNTDKKHILYASNISSDFCKMLRDGRSIWFADLNLIIVNYEIIPSQCKIACEKKYDLPPFIVEINNRNFSNKTKTTQISKKDIGFLGNPLDTLFSNWTFNLTEYQKGLQLQIINDPQDIEKRDLEYYKKAMQIAVSDSSFYYGNIGCFLFDQAKEEEEKLKAKGKFNKLKKVCTPIYLEASIYLEKALDLQLPLPNTEICNRLLLIYNNGLYYNETIKDKAAFRKKYDKLYTKTRTPNEIKESLDNIIDEEKEFYQKAVEIIKSDSIFYYGHIGSFLGNKAIDSNNRRNNTDLIYSEAHRYLNRSLTMLKKHINIQQISDEKWYQEIESLESRILYYLNCPRRSAIF